MLHCAFISPTRDKLQASKIRSMNYIACLLRGRFDIEPRSRKENLDSQVHTFVRCVLHLDADWAQPVGKQRTNSRLLVLDTKSNRNSRKIVKIRVTSLKGLRRDDFRICFI
jgi:hypothetical protein